MAGSYCWAWNDVLSKLESDQMAQKILCSVKCLLIQIKPLWLLLCRNSTDPDLCAKNYDKPKQFSPGFFSVGCACNKNITLGYEIMLVWVYTNLCWYHGYYWLKAISMPLFLNLFFHWHLYLVNWLTLTFPKVPESPRNIFRLIECRDINATKLKGV